MWNWLWSLSGVGNMHVCSTGRYCWDFGCYVNQFIIVHTAGPAGMHCWADDGRAMQERPSRMVYQTKASRHLLAYCCTFMCFNHSIFGVSICVIQQKNMPLSREGLWHICQTIRDNSVLFARKIDKAASKNDAQACSMLAKSSWIRIRTCTHIPQDSKAFVDNSQ